VLHAKEPVGFQNYRRSV